MEQLQYCETITSTLNFFIRKRTQYFHTLNKTVTKWIKNDIKLTETRLHWWYVYNSRNLRTLTIFLSPWLVQEKFSVRSIYIAVEYSNTHCSAVFLRITHKVCLSLSWTTNVWRMKGQCIFFQQFYLNNITLTIIPVKIGTCCRLSNANTITRPGR